MFYEDTPELHQSYFVGTVVEKLQLMKPVPSCIGVIVRRFSLI